MSSSITLYDDAGNPVVVSGEQMKSMFVTKQWVDETLNRAEGTDYVNTELYPITVSVSYNCVGATNATLLVDGKEVANAGSGGGDTAVVDTMVAIIPAGSTYSVDNYSTLYNWFEYKIGA